jgi:hypothetical protein
MFSETTPEPVTGFDAVFGFIMSTATFPVPSDGAEVGTLLAKLYIRHVAVKDIEINTIAIRTNNLSLKAFMINTPNKPNLF